MKVCVIIPAYNEEASVSAVIRELKRLSLDVLLIDDGSADRTLSRAREAGAVVLRNEDNRGKGASLVKGFAYALDNGYDAVITMDADGQHLTGDIPVLLDAAADPACALVVGNRMHEPRNMPLLRVFTNRFMSWLKGGSIVDRLIRNMTVSTVIAP